MIVTLEGYEDDLGKMSFKKIKKGIKKGVKKYGKTGALMAVGVTPETALLLRKAKVKGLHGDDNLLGKRFSIKRIGKKALKTAKSGVKNYGVSALKIAGGTALTAVGVPAGAMLVASGTKDAIAKAQSQAKAEAKRKILKRLKGKAKSVIPFNQKVLSSPAFSSTIQAVYPEAKTALALVAPEVLANVTPKEAIVEAIKAKGSQLTPDEAKAVIGTQERVKTGQEAFKKEPTVFEKLAMQPASVQKKAIAMLKEKQEADNRTLAEKVFDAGLIR